METTSPERPEEQLPATRLSAGIQTLWASGDKMMAALALLSSVLQLCCIRYL